MISAKEARRRTLLSTKLKGIIQKIDEDIINRTEAGWYYTSITFAHIPDKVLLDTLIKELESLGYKVKWIPAKPCPNDCRSDQWDFNSYLRIDWAEEG